MTSLKLDKFGGMLPAWDSRLLPDGQADYSLNTYLFSGALIGWRQPKLLHQLKNRHVQIRLPHPQQAHQQHRHHGGRIRSGWSSTMPTRR